MRMTATDWNTDHEYHIDLWTGSSTVTGGPNQTLCEDSLPGGQQTIVLDPPSNLDTITTPFYDNGACNYQTFPVGSDSTLCSGGSSGSSASAKSLSTSDTAPAATPTASPTY